MSDDAFLKDKIFRPIADRVKSRGEDSLKDFTRFVKSGIEGWLKVEAVQALGSRVRKLQNKGPDLELETDDPIKLFIELKAATDFNIKWITQDLYKYLREQEYKNARLFCLFLGADKDISTKLKRLSGQAAVIAYRRFMAGNDEWIIGLIGPCP
ncbi:MAG: hypothetical protein K6U10_08225 [Acidobacteriia bacterium]|nr:hypothetical protein [Methyloceanibacter sp.]MBX5494569.1 hypothetical protein [Bryobacteraceae bacterium]MCL6491792.1 hypothetical protein [Terriglobia bacterium]